MRFAGPLLSDSLRAVVETHTPETTRNLGSSQRQTPSSDCASPRQGNEALHSAATCPAFARQACQHHYCNDVHSAFLESYARDSGGGQPLSRSQIQKIWELRWEYNRRHASSPHYPSGKSAFARQACQHHYCNDVHSAFLDSYARDSGGGQPLSRSQIQKIWERRWEYNRRHASSPHYPSAKSAFARQACQHPYCNDVHSAFVDSDARDSGRGQPLSRSQIQKIWELRWEYKRRHASSPHYPSVKSAFARQACQHHYCNDVHSAFLDSYARDSGGGQPLSRSQ
ncbi:hypothetical protein MTO96_041635, partial [Rhipicephalus appendiculatus]